MFCRYKRLRIGQQVTLRNPISSYWLPKGLEEGTTATLLKSDYGTLTIEQNGRQWEIPMLCVEHEMEYQVRPNCWLPEDHPETIKETQREKEHLARLQSQDVSAA